MAEATALWELLRQAADPIVTDALKRAVETGSDRSLNRINPLAFAAEHGLNEEAAIGALVHAARLGIFDMSWNMLCPGCGGVLETGVALRSINRDHYFCAFCVQDSEPTLDQLVEVTFTVDPRVRRIGAHDPNSLPLTEYMRQIFWSSGAVVPGASIRITNEETNVALSTASNAQGEYTAPSLPPSSYTVRVEKAGFSFDAYPKVKAYLNAIRKRPAWKETPKLPML